MLTVGLIPLDDRPITSEYPVKLCQLAGLHPLLPPASALGRFLTPGSPGQIQNWLETVAPRLDYLLVSVDMLCYGGLVASRKPSVAYPGDALLRWLQEFKRRNPELHILAFNIIMRTSITTASDEDYRWWRMIRQYSELIDKVEVQRDANDVDALHRLKRDIPHEILVGYLKARERNHAVNRRSLDLAAGGVFDFLLLLQEDASPFGVHKKEQRVLQNIIQTKAIDNTAILPGADEGLMILLSRLISSISPTRPKVRVEFSHERTAGMPASFEDRPLRETVKGQLVGAGAQFCDKQAVPDLEFFVHTPPCHYRDHCEQEGLVGYGDRETVEFVHRIAKTRDNGVCAVVADAAFANGSDPAFLARLLDEPDLGGLISYAGWNTAGNSIGCALATAAAARYSLAGGTHTARLAQHLFLERLCEDWLYQTRIRHEANRLAWERGWSPWNLPAGGRDVIEGFIAKELTSTFREVYQRKLAGKMVAGLELPDQVDVDVCLPWDRTFEIRVTIKH